MKNWIAFIDPLRIAQFTIVNVATSKRANIINEGVYYFTQTIQKFFCSIGVPHLHWPCPVTNIVFCHESV